MPGKVLHELHALWCRPERRDEYIGTLVNAWLAQGGVAKGLRVGEGYVDVGTLHGYRAAIRLLEDGAMLRPAASPDAEVEKTKQDDRSTVVAG